MGTTYDINETLFWEKVDATGDCWDWTAALYGNGYGMVGVKRGDGAWVPRCAHRVAWELLIGDIPDGLVIDHLCINKKCVNPDHLRAVTQFDNQFVSPITFTGRARYQFRCSKGHPLSGENLYLEPKNGKRHCVECKRAASRRAYRKRRRHGIDV